VTALPSDYDSDPGRYLASTEWPHDDVHPYVAARLADAGARTVLDVGGGTGKLARLLPGLSMRCLLIDLSVTMLALAPRPAVRAADHAAAFLSNHGMSEQDARLAAATLDLPLTLTMRGCFVYATKAPGAAEAASPSSRSTG